MLLGRFLTYMVGLSTLAPPAVWALGAPLGGPQAGSAPPVQRRIEPGTGESAGPARTVVTAFSGQPYGVARIELPLGQPRRDARLPVLEVSSDSKRLIYPVTRDIQVAPDEQPRRSVRPGQPVIGGGRLLRRIGDMVRELTEEERPLTVGREVLFLFRGDEPLQVRLSHPDAAGRTELMITPEAPAAVGMHADLLVDWWDGYGAALMRQMDEGDYPPVIESYLLAQLSNRLGLPLPPGYLEEDEGGSASLWDTLQLVAGAEAAHTSILRRAAVGATDSSPAELPPPPGPQWSPTPVEADQGEVAIEPMASRVPPECFYLRFGSFANMIWFRDLSEEFGGDISRMITLRGLENDAARRFEAQLCLQVTELSRALGEAVIEDQAMIGHDLFLADGASAGVLMRARNSLLLKSSLQSDRAAVLRNDPSVKETSESIGGVDVSLLASPDNRIRSFMVADGQYVLVSNSRALVERFLQVGRQGEQSLADTAEFRMARRLVPLQRDDTIFAYISPQMLTGLVGPEYLIEVRRRLQAQADMTLLRLARLAASAEGQPLEEIDELIDAGYLPVTFGERPDGSGLIAAGQTILDSRRGARGSLLPIADVPLQAVNAEEQQWYQRIADYHSTQWQQMDPIVVGIRRQQADEAPVQERLDIHLEIAPWSPEKYGSIARQLGPPTRVRIDFAPDDIIAAQAHVVSDQLRGSIPPHHLFVAIKDTKPPQPEQFDGLFKTIGALRSIPGYLGAWPLPGVIDRLPLGIGRGQPVGPGMTRLVGGLHRFQGGGFSILSFYRDVLEASLPHIIADEADDEAQVRLMAHSLQGTELESWANELLYRRTGAASQAGAQLLDLLTRQLQVPRQQALGVANDLLGGRLQDPLGGQYQLDGDDGSGRPRRWTSSVWGGDTLPATPPTGYLAQPLVWFRGGRAGITQLDDRLIADAVVQISRGR